MQIKQVRNPQISKIHEERLRALSLDPDTPPLTVAEAAKSTNTSQEFWRTRIRERRIEFIRFGRSIRIPVSTIIKETEIVPAIEVDVL